MIDIILPCYKCIDTIEDTVNSIIAQSYDQWRLIVVIDGPDVELTQKIFELTKSLKNTVILPQPKNIGVAAARNIGIEHSTQEFIAFIDSDDVWHRDKLQKQISLMTSNSDAVLCATQCIRFSGGQIPLDRHIGSDIPIKKVHNVLLWIFNPYVFSSIVVRRSSICNLRFASTGHEDYDFLIRLHDNNKSKFKLLLKAELVYYRLVIGSQSGNVLQSAWKTFKLKSDKFGLSLALITFPLYLFCVLTKRYLRF